MAFPAMALGARLFAPLTHAAGGRVAGTISTTFSLLGTGRRPLRLLGFLAEHLLLKKGNLGCQRLYLGLQFPDESLPLTDNPLQPECFLLPEPLPLDRTTVLSLPKMGLLAKSDLLD